MIKAIFKNRYSVRRTEDSSGQGSTTEASPCATQEKRILRYAPNDGEVFRDAHTWFVLVSLCVLLAACNPSANRSEEFLTYDRDQYERVAMDYRITGSNDTVLLFIHGWNLNQSYWDRQVKEFSDRYKTVTLDLAGHGNSGKNRTNWTAESFARDIVQIIKKEELDNIILIGHSMGGEISLEVFDQVPGKIIGIIGIDNFKDVAFSLTPKYLNEFEKYHNRFKRNYSSMADDFARSNIRSTNREVINRIVKDYKSADPKIALAIFQYMLPKYEEAKYHLQSLPFPLRIIASDYEKVNEDALKKYSKKGYEIKWIESSGHFPMVEQPEQFHRALTQLLESLKHQ